MMLTRSRIRSILQKPTNCRTAEFQMWLLPCPDQEDRIPLQKAELISPFIKREQIPRDPAGHCRCLACCTIVLCIGASSPLSPHCGVGSGAHIRCGGGLQAPSMRGAALVAWNAFASGQETPMSHRDQCSGNKA